MAADRTFRVGATVVLLVRVSKPGRRDPDNPPNGVQLVGMSRDGIPVPIADKTFTLVTDGLYSLIIPPSENLAPGTYSWLAQAVKSPTEVANVEDTFVVQAANTVLAP